MVRTRCRQALTLGLFMGGLLISAGALAQRQPPTMDELDAAVNRNTDQSYAIIKGVFGQFAENPFLEVGTPDTLLGHVFLISNLVIMGLGMVWLTYNVIAGILTSAHEGRVLGQRMSSAWFPVRVTVGVGGMLPVFGGFSALQALMMWIALLGIGAGNMALTESVKAAANYAPLVQSDRMVNPLGSGVLAPEVADTLFMSQVCVLANRHYDRPDGFATTGLLVDNLDSAAGNRGNSLYGERLCGGVSLTGEGLGGDNTRSDSGLLALSSYRVNSVDYAAIAQAGRDSMIAKLRTLNAQIEPIAGAWFIAYRDALENGVAIPAWPTPRLDAARRAARASGQNKVVDNSRPDAIRREIIQTITRDGWSVLGAWNTTFAEANAAIVDAANAYTVQVFSPGDRVGFSVGQVADQLRGMGNRALSYLGLGSVPQTDQVRDAMATLERHRSVAKPSSDCIFDSWQTETGNCSVGQAIALRMIDGLAGDSGGDGLVNPIIASKNVGDWMMTLPQALYAGQLAAAAVPAGKAVSAAAAVAENAGGMALAKINAKVAGSNEGIFSSLAKAMFIIGAILAIYIPFIPFITWVSGLIGYFVVLFEGMVAAQLHGFAHLSGDGEGMGGRTEKGYTHMLHLLLRPTLMVISFFIATAMVIMIGTLETKLFGAALANVQGNSVTGFATIVGVCAVYMILLLMTVQSIYNMVYEIPDRCIGWLGTATNSFGRELDAKVENLTHTAIRWSGGVNPVGR